MTSTEKKILIIYPSFLPNFDANISLCLIIQEMVKRGASVDVCIRGDSYASVQRSGALRLFLLPGRFFDPMRACTPLHAVYRVLWGGDSFSKETYLFSRFSAHDYSCIVGVDPAGISVAHMLNRFAAKPLVYVSYELLFEDEIDDKELPVIDLKKKEIEACKHVTLALLQDEERADAFSRENGFARDKIALCPVSPPSRQISRSRVLKEKFKIAADKKIVLFLGATGPWASTLELPEMVSYWPENYCLFVHTFYPCGKQFQSYFSKSIKEEKIYIAHDFIPEEDLYALISSADYGLAPYRPVPHHWTTYKNLYYLGFSSGKVANYALCGLPILARSLPVFEREFAQFKCGKTYTRIAETGELLSEMGKDYASYSEGARRFYRERLDPSDGVRHFCDELMKLATP